MSEDNPVIRPEPNDPEIKPEPIKPEAKSEFIKPESKSEFSNPEPEAKSAFSNPAPKSEFMRPEPKSAFSNPEPEAKSAFSSNPEPKFTFIKPEPKSEFDNPAPKSEFDNPAPKSEFDNPDVNPKKKHVIKPKFKKERQHAGIRFRFKLIFVIIILALGIYFGTRPAIESLAKFLIGRIFVNSTVSIGGLSINPTRQISLLDVKISRGKIYEVMIKEASLDFDLSSLLQKFTSELSLKDVKFISKSPQTKLSDLIKSIHLNSQKKILSKPKTASGQPKPKAAAQPKDKTGGKTQEQISLISKFDVPSLSFEVNIRDAKASGTASFSLNLQDKQLGFLNLAAREMYAGKVFLRDIELSALQGQRTKGSFKIGQAYFYGLKVKNVKSRAVLEGLILSLDRISGVFLSKNFAGDLTLNLWPVPECTSNLKFGGISASDLAKGLGWDTKINASGKLYGKAIFRSEGKNMAMLDVNFVSNSNGAMLSISDAQTLRDISRQSREPLEKVSANFTDYRYEKGEFLASLLEDRLSLQINLGGKQGKRNLKFDLIGVDLFGAK